MLLLSSATLSVLLGFMSSSSPSAAAALTLSSQSISQNRDVLNHQRRQCYSNLAMRPLASSNRGSKSTNLHINRGRALMSSAKDVDCDRMAIAVNTRIVTKSTRQIDHVEQFARLPIWPIWSGVLLFLTSRLSSSLAASIEDAIGGRVCPNFFTAEKTSPFVLMVHHRHSFSVLDPIRFIQRTFFPEGFPSHPHRGFVTVTYCLKGGMIHRDSLGTKQSYGAENHHDEAHVQWLTAGAGIQHEEMWDTRGNALWNNQELFQIWLNLPSEYKMSKPKVELLTRHIVEENDRLVPEGRTPVVELDGVVTTVVCGEYNGLRATVDCPTNAAILRLHFKQKATWRHIVPKEHETAILYIRKGSVRVGDEFIPVHHTAYLSREGAELVISSVGEADVLLLSGEPLREPIASQGSMVMNTEKEIQEAYLDYQRGFMGLPWSEKLPDEEWTEHIKKNPSKYKC